MKTSALGYRPVTPRVHSRNDKRTHATGFAWTAACIGPERPGRRVGRDGGCQEGGGRGRKGVASRVTVGARVSICFGGSYSTLSGPPQIGLGGERAVGGEVAKEGGLSCCGIGRLGYLGNHIKV